MNETVPLVDVRNLKKYFPNGVRAVDGVSFTLSAGQTLGLVGESGCGKSTVGRVILRLTEPTSGRVIFNGIDLAKLSPPDLRALRKEMQIIFQDPFASLNPRMTAGRILEEPFLIHGHRDRHENKERVAELLRKVGLSPDHRNRYPHQFSGGQRQRLGIARAIALNPKFIVADEPVSALDVSIQAQILNLLQDLQGRMGLAYLFISHDLAVVRHLCDRVAVMYLGKLVEIADTEALHTTPRHPYTEALLAAIPKLDPKAPRIRPDIQGDPPSASHPPSGCAFHTRCPLKEKQCEEQVPELKEVAPGHFVACHLRS